MENIIVGITGASGAAYGRRLLQILCRKGYNVHLVVSDAGALVIKHELGIDFNRQRPNLAELLTFTSDTIYYHDAADIGASISSSRYPVKAMAVVPCSMNTLCSIAHGIASNLIQRAASVTIKEGRRLIVSPRETPLSPIHLEAMLKLSSMGVCILPAMPGFYHHPKTTEDMVDFVAAKILDALGIEHTLVPEWSGEALLDGKVVF